MDRVQREAVQRGSCSSRSLLDAFPVESVPEADVTPSRPAIARASMSIHLAYSRFDRGGHGSRVAIHHCMIVHDIRVERGVVTPGDESSRCAGVSIVVGATNIERWRWELEAGRSGAGAKTLVYAELVVSNERWAPVETAGLHVARQDPTRPAAIAAIPVLFELAWEIRDRDWSEDAACEAFYGRRLDEFVRSASVKTE